MFAKGFCDVCGRPSTVTANYPCEGDVEYEMCEMHFGGFVATGGARDDDEPYRLAFRGASADLGEKVAALDAAES